MISPFSTACLTEPPATKCFTGFIAMRKESDNFGNVLGSDLYSNKVLLIKSIKNLKKEVSRQPLSEVQVTESAIVIAIPCYSLVSR